MEGDGPGTRLGAAGRCGQAWWRIAHGRRSTRRSRCCPEPRTTCWWGAARATLGTCAAATHQPGPSCPEKEWEAAAPTHASRPPPEASGVRVWSHKHTTQAPPHTQNTHHTHTTHHKYTCLHIRTTHYTCSTHNTGTHTHTHHKRITQNTRTPNHKRTTYTTHTPTHHTQNMHPQTPLRHTPSQEVRKQGQSRHNLQPFKSWGPCQPRARPSPRSITLVSPRTLLSTHVPPAQATPQLPAVCRRSPGPKHLRAAAHLTTAHHLTESLVSAYVHPALDCRMSR